MLVPPLISIRLFPPLTKQCDECIEKTQKVCKKCCGGYCLVHNEGSSENFVSGLLRSLSDKRSADRMLHSATVSPFPINNRSLLGQCHPRGR